MEASLIAEFTRLTGCDVQTAHMYLQTLNWNLESCLKHFHKNQSSPSYAGTSEVRQLARGISRATDNENLVNKARGAIARDFENNRLCTIDSLHMGTTDTTFTLPDFSGFGEEFKKFLEKDLIEKSVMAALEGSMRLNWWCDDLGMNHRLWPLSTTGDGNCLLHAASLSTYGFHDRMLTLRHALHSFIVSCEAMVAIKRRWRWQQTKENNQCGVQYSEIEWEREWSTVVDISSTRKRNSNQEGNYEGLEEIHILVLAHVLRRSIIVISETVLKDSYNQPLSPINFGGIYLPFEFRENNLNKNPILLVYDMAHFSGLVFMQEKDYDIYSPCVFYVPVTDCNKDLLPIQFSVDPGADFDWSNYLTSELNSLDINERVQLNLLRPYLDVVDVSGNAVFSDNESEDEIERHYVECVEQPEGDGSNIFAKQSRATKQLQVLGKQMGSIGKSMSKSLKKNFGSFTKLGAKPKKKEQFKEKMLCAMLTIRRHAYQSEMINNYLHFAIEKFIREHLLSEFKGQSQEEDRLIRQAVLEGLVRCVNTNCESYATCFTSYMCKNCYETQKKQELSKIEDSVIGIGKSKFYREPDSASYSAVKLLPKTNVKCDQTLYLSNSTFFNDTDLPYGAVTDLNENVSALGGVEDKENVKPRAEVKGAGDSVALKAKFELKIPLEQLMSEFDFGKIPVPRWTKYQQQTTPKKDLGSIDLPIFPEGPCSSKMVSGFVTKPGSMSTDYRHIEMELSTPPNTPYSSPMSTSDNSPIIQHSADDKDNQEDDYPKLPSQEKK